MAKEKELLKKQKKEEKKYLHWQRKSYAKSMNQVADMLNKYMLILSSGTFGLSLTFVRTMKDGVRYPGCLLAGWIFFALSILVTLLAFLFGENAFQEAMREVRNLLKNVEDVKSLHSLRALEDERKYDSRGGNWTRYITLMEVLSVVFFGVGIIFLIYFTYSNIAPINYGCDKCGSCLIR